MEATKYDIHLMTFIWFQYFLFIDNIGQSFKIKTVLWNHVILTHIVHYSHHAVVGDAWVAVAPEDERHGGDEVDEDASTKTTVHFCCVCAETTSVLKLPQHHEVASHPQGTAQDGDDDVLQTPL